MPAGMAPQGIFTESRVSLHSRWICHLCCQKSKKMILERMSNCVPVYTATGSVLSCQWSEAKVEGLWSHLGSPRIPHPHIMIAEAGFVNILTWALSQLSQETWQRELNRNEDEEEEFQRQNLEAKASEHEGSKGAAHLGNLKPSA